MTSFTTDEVEEVEGTVSTLNWTSTFFSVGANVIGVASVVVNGAIVENGISAQPPI